MKPSTSLTFPVNRDTPVGPLLRQYPVAQAVVQAYGLHCQGCFAAEFDTIGQGAALHGLPNEEIDHLLADLNATIESFHA